MGSSSLTKRTPITPVSSLSTAHIGSSHVLNSPTVGMTYYVRERPIWITLNNVSINNFIYNYTINPNNLLIIITYLCVVSVGGSNIYSQQPVDQNSMPTNQLRTFEARQYRRIIQSHKRAIRMNNIGLY